MPIKTILPLTILPLTILPLTILPLLFLLSGVQVPAAEITSPEEFLGFQVGSDRKLADWQQISSYFRLLDEQSDRVLVQEVGRTTEGNAFLLATISSPQNLEKLEEYRQIQKLLADPRRAEESVEALIRKGKTIVLITCGIHSTEVASPQMSLEFAWEMASSMDRETLEVLEDVIFLFVPSLNPDGVNIVVNWYRETVGTPAEGTGPPRLYQKYVGHDNNRDWYMFTQKETRIAIQQLHNRWHPQIVYDVHQMGTTAARIFVPPFIDPIDPNVDPLIAAQIVDIGGFMFSALVASGRKGVVTNAIYDAFTPARAYQHYHGGVRLLSESASARLATPVIIAPEQLQAGRNYHAARSSWNFPEPWPGGEWRVRDIVEDQKVALKACLLHAARNRSSWLRNFYQIGLNAIRREDPHAFLIPARQKDHQGLYDLLETLDFGLVEIHRAQESFQVEAARCSSPPFCAEPLLRIEAGDYLVLQQQPYSSFARTLLEIQKYPELRQYPGGPLKRPYDVTAQTLGTQLGVSVYQIHEGLPVRMERLEKVVRPSGTFSGTGSYWLFSHENSAFARLANRLLTRGHRVDWATYGFRVGDRPYPVGTLMARAGQGSDEELRMLLQDLPVHVERVEKWPQLAWQRIRKPRVGLYQSYDSSMDEGWTRWILEQNEFYYTSLLDRDIRKGQLQEFDVILFAEQSAREIREGLSEPYPQEFRGGIGKEGMKSLKRYARQGGTLVFLGKSAQLPADEWKVGFREVVRKLPRSDFFVPGSLLRIQVNRRHPIGYGMSEQSAAMFVKSPAFEADSAVVVASYSEEDLLLSGWIDGAEYLTGKKAVFEVPIGKGRIIVIGFRCQFRAQTRVTYKLLFNSIFYATTR